MGRRNGRGKDELRPVSIQCSVLKHPLGSTLIKVGDTQVLCAASVEEKVPPFLKGGGRGWITAEYSLLPSSTETRTIREVTKGRIGGRTFEIQRLIGRSLRSVTNLNCLGERTFYIDCDVIQADGGTRTAAITGGFVALSEALWKLMQNEVIKEKPLYDFLAATSVGIVNSEYLLDLNFEEDVNAQVDMNIVQTGEGKFVEVQGTAEGVAFTRTEMDALLNIAQKGIMELIREQRRALGTIAKKVVSSEKD